MASWGLAQAKARLSEVVECAQDQGVQEITRNGKPVAMVVSAEEWRSRRAASGPKGSLVAFFRKSPAFGLDAEFKRVEVKPRKVKF